MRPGDFEEGWALTEEQKNFGCLRTNRGALPLSELHLEVALRGLDYRLKLRQTFVNVHSDSIEAVYTFPLAAGAALAGFTLSCGERVVRGQLQERGQARRDYQESVRGALQVALVEEERPEIFTMTVGNLPSRELVHLELELEGPLDCIDQAAVFRFPLLVAPRFIPGQPLGGQDVGRGTSPDTRQTPDASRITPPTLLPGYPNPVIFSLEIQLDSPLFALERLRSSIPLEVDGRRLYYAPARGGINHDFALALPFGEEMQSCVQLEESGVFCLTLVPPAQPPAARRPVQVLLLLDTGASMQGWALEAARECATGLLSHLTGRDSFGLLRFADSVTGGDLQPASDSACSAALESLEGLQAGGGSQLAPALRAALLRLRAVAGERHLVLLSNGRVGNEAEILSLVAAGGEGVRISAIGLGAAVNAGFLEQLARQSGGLCQLAQNEQQLEAALGLLRRVLVQPRLCDIRLVEPMVCDLVYGQRDLYEGMVTRIYGRLVGEGPALRVVASRPDGSQRSLEIPIQACPGRTLERLWARQQVLEWETAYLVRAEGAPGAAQIVEFSLAHGVLCRFTAFWAVDGASQVEPQTQTLVQAVEPVLDSTPSHPYRGTIRVDLLPTEKRGFRVDPLLVALLMVVILIGLMLLWRWAFGP